jgi:hypothetical protein
VAKLERRFPQHRIEDDRRGLRVKDRGGQTLAYVYFRGWINLSTDALGSKIVQRLASLITPISDWQPQLYKFVNVSPKSIVTLSEPAL